jgi:hypothetical protein
MHFIQALTAISEAARTANIIVDIAGTVSVGSRGVSGAVTRTAFSL